MRVISCASQCVGWKPTRHTYALLTPVILGYHRQDLNVDGWLWLLMMHISWMAFQIILHRELQAGTLLKTYSILCVTDISLLWSLKRYLWSTPLKLGCHGSIREQPPCVWGPYMKIQNTIEYGILHTCTHNIIQRDTEEELNYYMIMWLQKKIELLRIDHQLWVRPQGKFWFVFLLFIFSVNIIRWTFCEGWLLWIWPVSFHHIFLWTIRIIFLCNFLNIFWNTLSGATLSSNYISYTEWTPSQLWC